MAHFTQVIYVTEQVCNSILLGVALRARCRIVSTVRSEIVSKDLATKINPNPSNEKTDDDVDRRKVTWADVVSGKKEVSTSERNPLILLKQSNK